MFLYGCRIWSHAFRVEPNIRVYETVVLRDTIGPRTDDLTGEWRKLHNEELSDLFLPTIHNHLYHHLANMQLCQLLNCSGLTNPEVSSAVSTRSFCQLVCSFHSIVVNLLKGILSVCCKMFLLHYCVLPQ